MNGKILDTNIIIRYIKGEGSLSAIFEEENIYKRIYHYTIDYKEWINKKENEEYKHVILEEEESKKLQIIPEGITDIGNYCFMNRNKLKELALAKTKN